ncbi:heavy metal transporter [Streptomyces amakusaensis]|uniref:ARB-07466-like C-terminal domain-containing protein n=1 Tax=Streptomyces amakusaensis TaxID=67271 RepID=A0ABW0AAL0_9ACTN
MSEPVSPVRRSRLTRFTAAFVVLLALIGYVVVQHVSDGSPPGCVVRAGSGGGPRYELQPEMAANAATISAVGTTRGLPERAVTIALATALQESALRNIEHGDRDSLGLFQQRPSKGWGTPKQILDPVYSAGKFYEHLVQVPGYSRLPLTVAAQRVQRSGFPQAYAKHEPDAALLAAALTGRAGATLNCTGSDGAAEAGDPARVRSELVRAFGPEVLPAVSGGPDRTAAASGVREISVPVPAAGGGDDGAAARRGWELAHWAVARSGGLRIEEIVHGNRVWSAARADEGWRTEDRSGPDGGVRLRVAR